MGASFTNLQVRVGPGDADAELAAVREAIRAALSVDFVEAGPDEEAERTAVIAPPLRGWISVYDEELDRQAEEPLVELARALSARNRVVSLLVHDSDVVDARLFEAGEVLDHYVSDPDFFEMPRSARAAVKGRPEAWVPILAPGADARALGKAWKLRPTFAEDLVTAMVPLLGWDADRALATYRHLAELPGSDGFPRLRLRARTRPEMPSLPPAFELRGWNPACELALGEPLPSLRFIVANVGVGTRGLVVVAGGEAITSGLVRLTSATLATQHGAGAEGFRRASAPFAAAPERDDLLAARFPDFEVPAAPEGPTAAASRAFEEGLARQVFVSVLGEVLGTGQGALHLSVLPMANPPGGTAQLTQLTIRPAARRTLRARPELVAQLRALEDPAVLSLLVTLADADPAACAAATRAIAEWSARVLPPKGSWDITTAEPSLGARPRRQKLKAQDVGHGPRWDRLAASLPSLALMTGQRSAPREPASLLQGGHPFLQSAGFTIQRGSLMYAEAEPLLVLGLWCPGGDEATRQHLASIADAFVTAGALQAFVARWAWAPFFAADTTPYELGAGIHGQATTTRAWCVRWLRAVTPLLWIGPELRAHLDETALAKAAELAPCGAGLRVTLRAGQTLDALEQALAPALPGHDDWTQASQTLRESLRGPGIGLVPQKRGRNPTG